MTNALIRRHAQRLGLTTEQFSAALLQYAAQQLADYEKEMEDEDPGSYWQTGDPPDFLELHMPADWLERYHDPRF